ncbi:MAG: malectin domain-containing carbohydrate-binding protein, partial [Armatimonadota bacterium]
FRLSAETGEQQAMYRLPLRRERYSLAEAQSFTLGPEGAPVGAAVVGTTAAGLQLTLSTNDTKVTNQHRLDQPSLGDSWELFFDLRPEAQRGGLYGPGAFQATVVPATIEQATASWKAGAGPIHPGIAVQGTRSDTGSETTVSLTWDEVRKLVGRRPSSFDFGLTLNSSDDGDKLTGRAHKFANADSNRLTSACATFALDAEGGAAAEQQPAVLPPELAKSRIWGYLAVTDDRVLGTVGTMTESDYIFGLDKADGRLRWLYTAQQSVSHNAIAIGDGRVYVIDRTSAAQLEQMKRRGGAVTATTTLVALDVATGETLWKTDRDIAGRSELWFANGVLLATSRGAMTAYSPGDGEVIWAGAARSRRFPVIVGNTIYGEPGAYDLRTGQPTTRAHPLTREATSWNFARAYGCGFVSAAPTMLFFRSGALGFYDLAGDSGIHNFGGIRPGCFINMIAAGGLVLIPEGSSSCTCSYNYQTSVALAPMTRNEDWSVFSQPTGAGIMRDLALNLGAPGDRRDAEGTMWVSYPRPDFHAALKVPLVADIPAGGGYYHQSTDAVEIRGTRRSWLYGSGCRGLRSLELPLVMDRRVAAPPCGRPPKVDGVLNDPCWDGTAPLVLADGAHRRDPNASAFLRSDEDNLYVGLQRRAPRAPGRTVSWTMATEGDDADVARDDSWTVLLSDKSRKLYIQLAVSASSARLDGTFTYGEDKALNRQWNGIWLSEVAVRPDAWTAELAVPWETLAALGLQRNRLTVDVKGTNRTGLGPPGIALNVAATPGFADVFFGELPEPEPKTYTVRLHFAELGDARAGERVFDIKLQDRIVLQDFDVVREAGNPCVAVVKEFAGIGATETMKIEFVPKAEAFTVANAPILSALELAAQ